MNMKPYLLAPVLAATVAAHAQQAAFTPPEAPPSNPPTEQVKYTLLKPQDKTSVTVKDGERTPDAAG